MACLAARVQRVEASKLRPQGRTISKEGVCLWMGIPKYREETFSQEGIQYHDLGWEIHAKVFCCGVHCLSISVEACNLTTTYNLNIAKSEAIRSTEKAFIISHFVLGSFVFS